MKRELCQRYLEDPEAHRAHLSECAECQAMAEVLETKVPNEQLRIEELPLAPWEGAAHRSWPLVLGGALAVMAFATALFAAAGTSPVFELSRAAGSSVEVVSALVRLGGGVVRSAPALVIASFIGVNAILIALLRRAPKGVDV